MKAMILAAGRGNRLRPLTDSTPKPLLKVGQWSLIEHHLFRLKQNQFTDIVINVAYLGDQIMHQLGNGERYGVKITYSQEGEGGFETGGGIHRALPLLGEAPFLVLNGDIATDYPFVQLLTHDLSGLIHLVLVDNFSRNLTGDFGLVGSQLSLASPKLTFAGIGVYHPNLFQNCIPGFFRLAPLLESAIAQGQGTGEHYRGEWRDVGTPADLAALQETPPPKV